MANKMVFGVEWVRGNVPDFSHLSVAPGDILEGLIYQPAGTTFIAGSDGRDYAYVFPTLFYRNPHLPGLEYVKGTNGSFQLNRVMTEISLGNARDSAVLDASPSGSSRFVVVDHGHEYAEGGDEAWPFGHVWLATSGSNGFTFKKLSSAAAFNHSVDTGDLNGDGLLDILVSNMGVRTDPPYTNMHAYFQSPDGTFIEESHLVPLMPREVAPGALTIANVDGDAAEEVIQVSYRQFEGGDDWGAIRVFDRDGSGNYAVTRSLPREGLFETMGGSRVVPFDYDQDGDLDLVISLEGGVEDLNVVWNGLEIYRNDGQSNFTRATDALLSQNLWRSTEMQFREFEVVDFDNDGFADIVLNGWAGQALGGDGGWNIAAQMFRNMGGNGFVQLSNAETEGLVLEGYSGQPDGYPGGVKYSRVVDNDADRLEIFLMQSDAAAVTIHVNPVYRNADESLDVGGRGTSVKGYGGNDLFSMQGTNLAIDGGSGLDTSVYSIFRENITVRPVADGLVVDYQTGSDSLRGVELIQFADQTLSIAQLAHQHNSNAVFRFYNSQSDTHFFTASVDEADNVVRTMPAFSYEGIAFNKVSSEPGDAVSVFRFFNEHAGTHFYTSSQAERDDIIQNTPGFLYEGVAYQANGSKAEGTTELYRFYNNNSGSHFYTANTDEMEALRANFSDIFSFEGVAYYVGMDIA